MIMMLKNRLQPAIMGLFAFLLVTSAILAASVEKVYLTFIDLSEFPTVNLYLAVSDLDGRPLVGLRPEEVTLFENEVPIEPVSFKAVEHPMLIGVVIDSSGSLANIEGELSRLDHAREVTRQLVDPVFNRLAIEDEVAIFAFEQGQPVRLLDFTSDHDRVIREGVNRVSTEGNSYTTLFDLLRQAIESSSNYGREEPRRRVLLLFSDGMDDRSVVKVDQVVQLAVEAGILLYTVGMGPNLGSNEQGSLSLRRLADGTGGRYLWFRPDQSAGQEAMQRFLHELVQQRQGYALSFQSNEFEDTPKVRVEVKKGGRSVQDIRSYRVPSQPPEVSLDTLQEGAEVRGMIIIKPIIVRQQRAIERVEYRVDGQLLYVAQTAPFSFEWDTEGLASAEGQTHHLTMTVIDVAGLERQISREVNVRSAPSEQPIEEPELAVRSLPDSNSNNDSTSSSSSRGLYAGLGIGLLLFVLGIAGVILWQRKQDQDQPGKTSDDKPQSVVDTLFVSGSKPTPATLVVANGAQKGKQFQISKSTVFLGRDELQADLVFEWDPRISRRHAKISRIRNQFYIWDLDSANGTRVNQSDVLPSDGDNIVDALPISNQATIQIGPELELTFYFTSRSSKKKSHYHSPTQPIETDDN